MTIPLLLPSMSRKHSLLILEGENVLFLVAVLVDDSSDCRSATSRDSSSHFNLILSTCSYSVNTPFISDSSTTPHPTARFVQRSHYKLVFTLQPNSFRCIATAVSCGTNAFKEFRVEDTAALQKHYKSSEDGDISISNCDGVNCTMSMLFIAHPVNELDFGS